MTYGQSLALAVDLSLYGKYISPRLGRSIMSDAFDMLEVVYSSCGFHFGFNRLSVHESVYPSVGSPYKPWTLVLGA